MQEIKGWFERGEKIRIYRISHKSDVMEAMHPQPGD